MSSDVFEYMKLQAERGDIQAQVQYSTFELNPFNSNVNSIFFLLCEIMQRTFCRSRAAAALCIYRCRRIAIETEKIKPNPLCAQRRLASMLFWGQHGISKDPGGAMMWFERSAMQMKDPSALYDYSILLMKVL